MQPPPSRPPGKKNNQITDLMFSLKENSKTELQNPLNNHLKYHQICSYELLLLSTTSSQTRGHGPTWGRLIYKQVCETHSQFPPLFNSIIVQINTRNLEDGVGVLIFLNVNRGFL